MKKITIDQARRAKATASSLLKKHPDVVSVGIGFDKYRGYILKVNLGNNVSSSKDLPGIINGVPVNIQITGVPKTIPSYTLAPN